ncbi:hypothetical protein AVEN_187759-1 [Araneus ventricosus]|uniref:Reverse transcriptase domain-containing protein n=1 Tax=Araneus ventricosus TaxID=182803 RepID=A0A4Y2C1T5_ARAVE|nr:hypothetical protein AVEN_187759-1 [Araneus ventricosus]
MPNGEISRESFTRINVPGDGSCLFWAITLAYLTPVKHNNDAFRERFERLFGGDSAELLQVQKLIKDHNLLLSVEEIYNADIFERETLKKLVTEEFRGRVVHKMFSDRDRFEESIAVNDFPNSRNGDCYRRYIQEKFRSEFRTEIGQYNIDIDKLKPSSFIQSSELQANCSHELSMGNLPIFLKNFLSHRTFRVRMENFYSDHFIQAEGVPQGSVLSVTLFIIHLGQILNYLPSYVHGNLYVDDLQISCQGSNMHLIERQLQNAVNKLVAWCNKNGHSISPEKSRCVHFCRKRILHLDPVFHVQNVAIPVVDDIRFLGVIFDRKLAFLPHILHLRKKYERSLNILKVLSKTSWGADRTSLLRIYQAVILSRIDYGYMVYVSARPTVLRRLDKIHHSGLRICTAAFRTSPVESLYIISHQLSLDSRRQKISALHFFRAQSVPKHPISQSYQLVFADSMLLVPLI